MYFIITFQCVSVLVVTYSNTTIIIMIMIKLGIFIRLIM